MLNTLDLKYLLEDLDEHTEYENYLSTHIANVKKGYEWIREHLPELLSEHNYAEELAYYGDLDTIIARHDASKYNKIPDVDNYYELGCEYDAYAEYFYGTKTPEVETAFDYAWLHHIHSNPHHWQHWLLQNDTDGLKILDMPYVFIIEMICDWWSFSWKENKLTEVFDWYEKHKTGIVLSDKTRTAVEHILNCIKEELNKNEN